MSYSRLETSDVLISSEKVSTPIWSKMTGSVITSASLVTSSVQEGDLSGNYYLDIYNKTDNGEADEIQFSIAYADKDGFGSTCYDTSSISLTPSRTVYGSCRSLILGDEEKDFYFNVDASSSNFWVISLERARYKEKLIPGSLKLTLQKSGSTDTGSIITLTDDSVTGATVRYLDSGRVYSIIASGSGVTGSYGYFLPDTGMMLLDCAKLDAYINTGSGESSVPLRYKRFDSDPDASGNRPEKDTYCASRLFESITSFELRSEETVTSNYIFVRARNSEFNYSMNPSNITETGELRNEIMINSPETYITTVGLYNDSNDLLAVAKLSKPLSKNFNKEALIRLKLDY